MSRPRIKRASTGQTGSRSSSQKKQPKGEKRYRVNVGDIVRFYSPYNHMFGTLGEVTHVLNAKRVAVKCIATGDPDYEGLLDAVLRTKKPSGKTPDGTDKYHYSFYITGIAFRPTPKPPKAPKTPAQVKVIRSPDELIEHLESGGAEKIAYHVPAPTKQEETTQ